MPLKALFGRSPLTQSKNCPLRPGRFTINTDVARKIGHVLFDVTPNNEQLLEPAFRMACLLNERETTQTMADAIQDFANVQEDLGGLRGTPAEQIMKAGAIWALYEWNISPKLLNNLMRWCSYVDTNWDTFAESAALRQNPSDLIALCENIYRVTGKSGVLNLSKKIRAVSMDWSGALSTYNAVKAASRLFSADELLNGAETEDWDESGIYTRQYLQFHAESLADGARTAVWHGVFSGSARDTDALRSGWEKLSRFHGAVCGGLTADALLGGGSPSCAVGTAALGAWLEAFAAQLSVRDSAWAAEALERILVNALPAVVRADAIKENQYVNTLKKDAAMKKGFLYREQDLDAAHILRRVALGFAAACASAVENTTDGVVAQLYCDGQYTVRLAEQSAHLAVEVQDDCVAMKLQMNESAEGVIRLRIPSWMEDAAITVNGVDYSAERVGNYLSINRTWCDGDAVLLRYMKELKVEEGYHHSASVYYGADLMAWVPDGEWRAVLVDDPCCRDGKVYVRASGAIEWKEKENIPQNLPVQPDTNGLERELQLVPYASTLTRLAQFPVNRS